MCVIAAVYFLAAIGMFTFFEHDQHAKMCVFAAVHCLAVITTVLLLSTIDIP